MAEELQELIEKIQLEGVKAAEDKSLALEAHAQKRAEEIVNNAERQAAAIIGDAKAQVARLEEGAKASIKQSARDTMLSLRKEITATLDRLVAVQVHKALSPDEMARILASIIKVGDNKEKVVISLRKEDAEKVEKALLSELGHEAKKGMLIKSTTDIHGGFLISYDSGKSYFDFSDKALAEYLAVHLKTGLADIIKDAAVK